MAERRSMNEALSLTEKERAFIQGEESSAPPKRDVARGKDDAKPPRKPKRSNGDRSKPRRHATRPKDSERDASSLDGDGSFGELLVPVTTRLSLDTANALRRACLERKLKRKKPYSQQEIIESAVRIWLTENGCFM